MYLRLVAIALAALPLALRAAEPAAVEPKPNSADADKPDRGELERRFEKELSGVELKGCFTTGEVDPKKPLSEESYRISRVSKLKGDAWLFDVRIRYGEHDMTLPLALNVQWAGDTPMIVMNKVPVPGLGAFSARVLFYDGKYSGTWDGKDHGGHLFGKYAKVEQAKAAQKPVATEPAKQP